MSDKHPRRAGWLSRRTLTIIAIVIFVSCLGFLAYGPDIDLAWGGIALLLGIPFAIGMLIGQGLDRRDLMGCFVWPTLAILALLFVGYLAGEEGIICVAMVMPLWIAAGIGGALTSLWNHSRRKPEDETTNDDRLHLAAWTVLPVFLVLAESVLPPAWTEHQVVREVTVDGTPIQIWPHMAEIRAVRADEGQWTFAHNILGIPRPMDARINFVQGKAVRRAQWGEDIRFEEHIVAQHVGKEMRWRFAFPDNSLQQHTDRHIAPNGHNLRILSGSYTLEPVSKDKTRIRLTTRYAMRTRLPAYLGWWGDRLRGDVQINVLQIIAERTTR